MGRPSAIVNLFVNWPCCFVFIGLILMLLMTYATLWMGYLEVDEFNIRAFLADSDLTTAQWDF